MLQNLYTIARKKGGIQKHYEFVILPDAVTSDPIAGNQVSSCIYGLRAIEDYASKVLGKKVSFFLLHESRFFPMSLVDEKDVVLDLSITELDQGSYLVMADITNGSCVLMEIAGRMTADESE